MDVHRCRFIPYPASAIHALAFSATNDTELGRGGHANLKLAVGRANGDIEIWSPIKGNWVQDIIFHGGRGRSVEKLAWTQESGEDDQGRQIPGPLRLFSAGYTSTVTEWSLATGLPVRHSSGNHSEIWCLAAQPRWTKAPADKSSKKSTQREGEWRGQNLVVGCADGTIALLSTADNDLHFSKFVARATAKRSKALSICYKDRHVVVAGFNDGAFRVYDTRNSTIIRTVTLGAAPKGGPRDILVWALKCLPNGHIVTGDSTGEVRFFEGQYYSQYQRLHGHDDDVMDIACNADGSKVFTAGLDSKTVLFSKLKGKWARISHKNNHDHDVKALASFESMTLSVLMSGGIDTNLTAQPMREYFDDYPHKMSTLPQLPQAASAPAARLVLTWWNQELNLHRLKHQSAKNVDEKGHTLVARIGLQGDENISSAAISPNGDFLVVSTSADVKFFQLSRRAKDHEGELKIRKIDLEEPLGGARQLQLSSNGKWLALITQSNEINLVRIMMDPETRQVRVLPKLLSLERQTRPKAKNEKSAATAAALQDYSRLITRIQFSPDGKVLAASDLSGFIDSWILEGHEDPTAPEINEPARPIKTSTAQEDDEDDEEEEDQEIIPVVILGQHWIRNASTSLLPKLASTPIILSFRPFTFLQTSQEPNGNPAVHPTRRNPHPIAHDTPKGPYHLAVLTSQHHLFEFDLLQGKLTDWSRNNPPANLPNKFTFLRDRAMGCSWHIKGESTRIWLYGSTWVQMLDLSKDSPQSVKPSDENIKRKRERGNGLTHKRPKIAPAGLAPETLKVVKGRAVKSNPTKENKPPLQLNGNTTTDDEGEGVDDEIPATGRLRREEQHQSEEGRENDGLPSFWQTRVYRSILGMVNLGERNDCLETAIIERPVHELDLPDKNMPAHEKQTKFGC